MIRPFQVLINGELAGTVLASCYAAARIEARRIFKRRCDCIG